MIITDIQTFVVGNPWKNWVFVQVHTDEGLTGVGEATGGLSTKPHEAQVHELKPIVTGQDPRNVRALWDHMFKSVYLNSYPAMAAVEMACWDIAARELGVPVWRLLGGMSRPRIRAYANGWYTGPRDRQGFAEAARAVVDRGYTALKFDPFGSAYANLTRGELRESLALVGAVREAVGESVDVLIEAHDRFSVPTAIEVGRALQPYEPLWLEAPVISTDLAALNEVAKAVPVRVAAGERFHDPRECADLLHARLIDIVQPELLECGGVQGLLAMAAIASAYGGWIAPHNAQSPLTTAVNAHVATAIQNHLIQEVFDDFLVSWSRTVVRGAVKINAGYIEVPEGPGYGVTFDEQEMAAHPYADTNFMRLFSPGWEGRRGSAPA